MNCPCGKTEAPDTCPDCGHADTDTCWATQGRGCHNRCGWHRSPVRTFDSPDW